MPPCGLYQKDVSFSAGLKRCCRNRPRNSQPPRQKLFWVSLHSTRDKMSFLLCLWTALGRLSAGTNLKQTWTSILSGKGIIPWWINFLLCNTRQNNCVSLLAWKYTCEQKKQSILNYKEIKIITSEIQYDSQTTNACVKSNKQDGNHRLCQWPW